MDLSQGMLSHQWVVSDDGTKFLNGKMEWGQTDYTNLIDAAYMLNDDFGYIQVSKFGRTSHVELLNAIAQLSHQKCKGFIIVLASVKMT